MPAEIRTARASDVDDLVAIENAAFSGDRISRNAFRRLVGRPSATVLVADENRAIAGYCVILFRSNSVRPRLYSVAAAPGVKGIGRLLLAAAERASRARGAGALRLEVREDNHRAIALYETSGFRRIGRIEGYYADSAAALRYEKSLADVAGQFAAGTAAA